MMINFITKVAMTAFVVASINALAGDLDDLTEMSLEELLQVRIVTIATGTEQTVAEAAAVTTVITADDIEAMGATDLDEVLETVPGLHVARNSLGYNPIYTIRGIYSDFNPEVLILINGISIKKLFAGNRSQIWGGMPIKAINRIEVIRGPGSAVYGADAFAGVINIITKTADDIDGTETGVRTGSFNTKDAWVLHGSKYNDIDVAFMIEYHDTDGHGATLEEDAQTQFDKSFETDVSHAPGSVNLQRRSWDIRLDVAKENWRFRSGFQQRGNFGSGAGVTQALQPTTRYSANRFTTDLTYKKQDIFTDDLDITAQASYFRTGWEVKGDSLLFPEGAFGGAYPNGYIGNTGISEQHSKLDISALYDGIEKHTIRLGVGYHYGDVDRVLHLANYGFNPYTQSPIVPGSPIISFTDTEYSFLPEKYRANQYLFLQDTWAINDKLELTTGLRYDKYSDFGSTINPRLALVWRNSDKFTSKLLYGQAFRAPAFRELYTINNPLSLGNPDLDAESISTWELAFSYIPTDKLQLSLNTFDYKIKDAIRFLPDTNQNSFIAQNAGSQDGYGFEFEFSWKLNKHFSLLGNYAYQKSTDGLSTTTVANAPSQQAYLRANWIIANYWRLGSQFNWVAGRKRVPGDNRYAVDDYVMTNLILRYKNPAYNWNIAFSVQNAFDIDAREPSAGPNTSDVISIPYDLPLTGRSYLLELNYKF
jgi:iron complex outermembrane receptor protein